jgi:hypothetical protein
MCNLFVHELRVIPPANGFQLVCYPEAVRHEREISNAARLKLDFAGREKCKLVLLVLRLSLAGNLKKPLMSLYGTE